MQSFCGLDFGTSNSTIGISVNNTCQLVPLDKEKLSIRSAIFCDGDNKEWVFGQEGVHRYLDGMSGRLMMSLKSVLGSSLMDDETFIFNEWISYKTVLSKFLKHIKKTAELTSQHELTQVVLGRPVHFHDTDKKSDRTAQNTLEAIATQVGFKEISFQYEPIAAALTYETTLKKEQLALIIDIGGGTSDFTVIRLHPGSKEVDRNEDVLANAGIHIAGTDFDHHLSIHSVMPLLGMGTLMSGSSSEIELPSSYFHDLTTWHMLSYLYNAKTISHVRSLLAIAHDKTRMQRLVDVLEKRSGHRILYAVEHAKQKLSELTEVILPLNFIENNLSTLITRNELNLVIHDDLNRIITCIMQTIALAGVKPQNISAIFYTGGSTKIPVIHEKINPLFLNAEIVQGDAFGSVGLGLTIDAQRKYG